MNLAVIGSGYVGLVSGTCFAEMGNNVICIDNNEKKLERLQRGDVTIYEPGLEILFKRNISQNRLQFSNDLEKAVLGSEVIFLCLPTPQDEDGSADLSHVLEVAGNIGAILKENGDDSLKIIVNKSTVPVGTGEKVKKILQDFEFDNFEVVSNPEFLKEGYAVDDFMKPDRIIIGTDSTKAMEKMKALYQPFVRQGNPIIEMDVKSAEVTKYAANSYLATRITFMNELANFAEKAGADIDLIRKGMGTDARIGKRFLFAGIGYGGSCFPKDVNALIKTSHENDSELSLLSVVDNINANQKLVLFHRLLDYFNQDIADKRIAIWGLAFKPNTDDMREAPSISIINNLIKNGAAVSAFDPAAMENAKYHFDSIITYAENDYEALENADALMILTEWNEFRNPDFDKIKEKLKNPVIFDGRNIYNPLEMKNLGFTYFSIGRQPIYREENVEQRA